MNQKLLLLLFCFLPLSSINADPIKIGTKFNSFPDPAFQKKINEGINVNTYDAFEYDLISLFSKYLNANNIEHEFVKMPLSSAVVSLTQANSGVDIIINNLSVTQDRKMLGIKFSDPYFTNPGIGVLLKTGDVYDKEKLLDYSYGCIDGTRSFQQIQIYNSQVPGNRKLDVKAYKEYDQLINDFQSQSINRIIGDITVLLTLSIPGSNVADYFDTQFSAIKDNIAMGIHKDRPELAPLTSSFVREYHDIIVKEENKWLSNTVNAWNPRDNRETNNGISNEHLLFGGLGLLGLMSLIFLIYNRSGSKKNSVLEEILQTVGDRENDAVKQYLNRFKLELEDAELARVGINMLNTAKKEILYVGSGGFMSHTNKEIADDWRISIYKALGNKSVTFKRVIDLPSVEELTLNKNANQLTYIENLYVWLYILYYDLNRYSESLKVVNTRGAAQWGYGLIIMVKDNVESLFFTAINDERLGTYLLSPHLGKKIDDMAKNAGNHGNNVDRLFLEEHYFNNLVPAKATMDFVNEYDLSNGGSPLSVDQISEIRKRAKMIAENINNIKL